MSVHDTVPVTTVQVTAGPPGAAAAEPALGRDVELGEGIGRAAAAGSRRSRARVSVDNTHCELYGICEQEAPGVFELGVDGRLRYSARPAAQQLAGVRQAARCCPMQAITVTEPR